MKTIFSKITHKLIKCSTCNNWLIPFDNCWLHPDTPCSEGKDGYRVTLEVADHLLNDAWIKKYDRPTFTFNELINNIALTYSRDIQEIEHQSKLDYEYEVERLNKVINNLKLTLEGSNQSIINLNAIRTSLEQELVLARLNIWSKIKIKIKGIYVRLKERIYAKEKSNTSTN